MASIIPPAALLCSAILLALLSPATPTYLGNALESGTPLTVGDNLMAGKYNFSLQHDCNLVLYHDQSPRWSSGTDGKGKGCELVLHDNGELIIFSDKDDVLWRTDTGGANGKYSLVLKENGDVVVYGSAVWSTGTFTNTTEGA
ncbi:hypothetical protein HPP92_015313 [Vanilla planifolia]|uniref:Bulb-type lectin domain-containing protein n=1 Tax=Vanilla planifolia TaxID=51239 RepID=A0A835UVP6_VANPL|nr:hypothetical protein HPP92_015313 [Vanilla planifolia]